MKKRKGFIFTNKRNSHRAIMAVILGIISMVSLGAVIFMAYRDSGGTTAKYGVIGLLAAVYSLIGMVLSLATVANKNYYRIFPVLGIILNTAVLGGIVLILYVGAN